MNARPATPGVVRWRAPSSMTNIGIAILVMGVCGALVFGAIQLFAEHHPRTQAVPVYGIAGSVAVALTGLVMIFAVPFMEVDFGAREVRRGGEQVADLGAARFVCLCETRFVYTASSGSSEEAISWGVAMVSDEVDTAEVARIVRGEPDDGRVTALMDGVPKPRARRAARTIASALAVPLVEVTADGELRVETF